MGGSPGRRGHVSARTGRPVTFSVVFTTSATEKPRPLPRLKDWLGLPFASQSRAQTWASARSLTRRAAPREADRGRLVLDEMGSLARHPPGIGAPRLH